MAIYSGLGNQDRARVDDIMGRSPGLFGRLKMALGFKSSARRELVSQQVRETPAGRHFIVSPHDDAKNLFDNAIGMSTHKISRRKEPLMPVFKDHAQRRDFKNLARARLATPGLDANELAAATHLFTSSRKTNARTNFNHVSELGARVYVQGHGQPADPNIYSDTRASASSWQVAQMLTAMNLPRTSQVRVNSCFGGTDRAIPETPTTWNDYVGGTLGRHVGDRHNTFAGHLRQDLQVLGRNNQVFGYMGPTGQRGATVEMPDGGTAVHMPADLGVRPLRRRDMRIEL